MQRKTWIQTLALAVAFGSYGVAMAQPPVRVATQSSSSSSSTGLTDNKPAPPAPLDGEQVEAALEKALGRTLSDAEKSEIKAALDTAKLAIDAAQADFLADVAAATGLTLDQVKTAAAQAPGKPKLLQNLVKLLNRDLTSTERKGIEYACKELGEARKAAMDELIATIASITGLENDEVAGALKPPPPPKPGSGSNSGSGSGSGGGTCNNGGQGGSQSGSTGGSSGSTGNSYNGSQSGSAGGGTKPGGSQSGSQSGSASGGQQGGGTKPNGGSKPGGQSGSGTGTSGSSSSGTQSSGGQSGSQGGGQQGARPVGQGGGPRR